MKGEYFCLSGCTAFPLEVQKGRNKGFQVLLLIGSIQGAFFLHLLSWLDKRGLDQFILPMVYHLSYQGRGGFEVKL